MYRTALPIVWSSSLSVKVFSYTDMPREPRSLPADDSRSDSAADDKKLFVTIFFGNPRPFPVWNVAHTQPGYFKFEHIGETAKESEQCFLGFPVCKPFSAPIS
jgi:hypothetical protein